MIVNPDKIQAIVCSQVLSQLIKLKICRNGGKSIMNVTRLRTLCVEIYKTINDLNPVSMNNIFRLKINGREVRDKWKLNLDIPK